MRSENLKARLDALYSQYDHRFVTPDPLEFVRAQRSAADREVVGFIASALAYGTVVQIKRSVSAVLAVLGDRPCEAVRAISAREAQRALRDFRHRFNDGRDVACLLVFLRQMLDAEGSVEGFFAGGLGTTDADVGPGLVSFAVRALALDTGGLYRGRSLPSDAGVRFFFCSPRDGSACKRLNLFLRWMVRRDSVDLGVWNAVRPSQLVMPIDAHTFAIARRVGLTRYAAPGWAMAVDVTQRLRRFDPDDPVKYDFALHRMGLWKRRAEIDSLAST